MKKVKDKSIRLKGDWYIATVEWYNAPTIMCGSFETLWAAQEVLKKYPRDVWDSYEHTHTNYREPDENSKSNLAHKPATI